MAHKEMKEMLKAAAILSMASLLTKILAAFYRVPYQNLVGDEGFYVYQQVYPLYGLAMTFSLGGIPLFLSKLLQEKEDLEEKQTLLKILYPIIYWLCFFLFAGLFLFSPWLAYEMGDSQLSPLIKVAACTFLLAPPLAFYRGYFQGIPWMTPTAISQLGEQFIRVTVIVLGAFLFMPLHLTVYQVAEIGYGGALIGGLVALGILLKENKRATYFYFPIRELKPTFKKKEPHSLKPLLKRLGIEGSLIFLYSSLLIFYQLVDSFIMKEALVKGGLSDMEGKIQKGIFDRGQPLVQLGLVVALGLTSTFLPMLTRQVLKKRRKIFEEYSGMFLRLTSALAGGATVGLICLLPAINFALFKDQEGLVPLRLFTGSVFLVAMVQVYENIMQSQNHFKTPLIAAATGLIVKVLTTEVLVIHLGSAGSSLATLLGLFSTLIFLKIKTQKTVRKELHRHFFLLKLIVSLSVMTIGLLIYQQLLGPLLFASRLGAFLLSIVGVCLGGGLFLMMVLSLKVFTIREWLLLPYGGKLLKIFQKR